MALIPVLQVYVNTDEPEEARTAGIVLQSPLKPEQVCTLQATNPDDAGKIVLALTDVVLAGVGSDLVQRGLPPGYESLLPAA